MRGHSARLNVSRRLEAERDHATRGAGVIFGVLIVSEQIPSSLIDSLIALGRAGVPGTVPGIRNAHEAFDEIVGRWTWSKSTAGRTPEDVAALIKGIVLLSRGVGGFLGGSGSPVIGLCWELRRRDPVLGNAVSEWVLANRTNEYEPFGSRVSLSVRTLADYADWLVAREARRQARRAALDSAIDVARDRRAAAATSNLANAVRRGDVLAIRALLAQGARPAEAVPGGGSLQALAASHGRQRALALLRELGIA